MGFKDALKTFGAIAVNGVCEDVGRTMNRLSKIESYMEDYESYSDEELMREYRKRSGDRKIACGRLLKRRGYGSR